MEGEIKAKRPFSAEYFFETKMNQKLAQNPDSMDGFDCVYQLEIGEKAWHLDLTSSERKIVSGSASDPDCTIIMSEENLEKLVRRNLNVPLALVTGKIKIKGDKGLALKLTKLFA